MERLRVSAGILLLLLGSGCGRTQFFTKKAENPPSCAVALAELGGSDPLDRDIAQLQSKARSVKNLQALEELGQRLIAKARITNDPGFYKIAESCAQCLQLRDPGNAGALLLRGHVMHQLHRFKEAEAIARQLAKVRRNVLDYGLLGDALMEQGRLEEAIDAYQQMVDIKPFFQSYVRVAHLHWLKGDLSGALQLMEAAIESASVRDTESVAWAYSRLAVYQMQAGWTQRALRSCEAALRYQSNYAPALLARGRALMSQGDFARAADSLKIAAGENPVPEYQWALMEALRSAGRKDEERAVEARLLATGMSADPRTFALYLASQGREMSKALDLSRRELDVRADAFTLDAVAWSLARSGRTGEARDMMRRAVAQGTVDARLFYHAGVIAAAAGDWSEARRWADKATAIRQMLLPSERERLENLRSHLRSPGYRAAG